MNTKKKKIKRLANNELKKVRGGVDLYEEFNNKVLGKDMATPGTDAVIEVGSRAVTLGFRIRWS
jgi:hypothetical protein